MVLSLHPWLYCSPSQSLWLICYCMIKRNKHHCCEDQQWMKIYQEKYMSIPEYIIIEESDQRLFDFLLLSSNFVNQVEHLKWLLSDDKIIKSRHIKKEELDFNSSKKVLARNHGLRLFSLNNRIPLWSKQSILEYNCMSFIFTKLNYPHLTFSRMFEEGDSIRTT